MRIIILLKRLKNSIYLITVSAIAIFSSFIIANSNEKQKYEYAYISVQGRSFSKKLVVYVDLGQKTKELETAKKYSPSLSQFKSYASVLNAMDLIGYELVDSESTAFSYQGTGGSYEMIYLFRKRTD